MVEEESIYCKMQLVEYFENEHPLFSSLNDINHAIDTVFYKPSLYNSQREYRMAIHGYEKKNIFYNDYWNKIDELENIRIIRK